MVILLIIVAFSQEVGFTTKQKTKTTKKKILPFVQLQRTTPPLPHPHKKLMSK